MAILSCDKEPLHIPSAVQPFGVLLVATLPQGQLVQVSDNVTELFGVPANQVCGKSLWDFLVQREKDELLTYLNLHRETDKRLVMQNFGTWSFKKNYDVSLLRNDMFLILEFESASDQLLWRSNASLIQSFTTLPGQSSSLPEFLNAASRRFKDLTQFNRVMIYQFAENGDGQVVAETKDDLSPSFLGQWFPASDIPQQARDIYLKNPSRLIANAHYIPVPLVPKVNPITGFDLDMSLCVLRAVSPVHLEYLRNMGVASSMSVSLIVGGRLWGLIIGHHRKAHHVPSPIRATCEVFGEIIAQRIRFYEKLSSFETQVALDAHIAAFAQSLGHLDDLIQSITMHEELFLQEFSSSGLALVIGGQRTQTWGSVPLGSDFDAVCHTLENASFETLYATASLENSTPQEDLAPAEHTPRPLSSEACAGFMAVGLSVPPKDFLVWFRPEKVSVLEWAGRPVKEVVRGKEGHDSPSYGPRKSFAKWVETLRGQSAEWSPGDRAGALRLRSTIFEWRAQQHRILSEQNRDLKRANADLESFLSMVTQKLKKPMRTLSQEITALSQCDVSQAHGQPVFQNHIQKMRLLCHRVEDQIDMLQRYAQAGCVPIHRSPVSLAQIIERCLQGLQDTEGYHAEAFFIPRAFPMLLADEEHLEHIFYSFLAEAYRNCIGSPKEITVGYFDSLQDNGNLLLPKPRKFIKEHQRYFYVRYMTQVPSAKEPKRADGPEFPSDHLGDLDFAFAQHLVERHDGLAWFENHPEEHAVEFWFTLGEEI